MPTPARAESPGTFTISFGGDVHFAERTAARLSANPATAFGRSAAVLSKADLSMVNLETAIAVGGSAEGKTFTFQAPPAAFTALKDAGVDIATMANNHGADATAAYAPYYTTVRGPVEHPARPLRLSTSGGCQTLPVHIRHA